MIKLNIGQSAAKGKMLSEEILNKIKSKEITSRRQLFEIIGRSKKLLQYLNDNQILVPSKYDKNIVASKLKQLRNTLGRIPIAQDDWALTARAQKYYGGWNNALKEIFGQINQARYDHLTDDKLLACITDHIEKYQRLPLREEFNGSSDSYPYWETYISRFNLQRWSSVYALIDFKNLKTFSQHGFGQIKIAHGNVYLSHQEFLIGKYLFERNIDFQKEVPYKNSNYIFDFYLPQYNIYIEYYGIGTKEYQERILEKRNFYAGRKVIEIFKHDNTIAKLDFEVQRL